MEAKSSIRFRADSDIPSAANVLVEVHREDGYPVEGVADPQAWLRSDALIRAWIAELDGAIVGHVALTRPQEGDAAPELWAQQSACSLDHIAVLGRLFVHPKARGHTLATNLVQAATGYGIGMNRRSTLDVMAKDEAAIRLYERLGWRQIGTTTHHFGDGQQIEALCYVGPQVVWP